MFKKGKKKQNTKFDDDLLGLDSTPTETDKTEDSDASSLREKIAKIKSKERVKPSTTVSFGEDFDEDNFGMQKKPLYNAQAMNNQEEEEKETLQQRMENKKYNTNYLDELRRDNARRNETARDMMNSAKTWQDLGHDEMDILENQEMEIGGLEDDEDDELNEAQQKEIEKAKGLREKKRKLNSGDFISLNNENRDTEDLYGAINSNKIMMNIFNEDSDQKENKSNNKEMEEESDEEFNAMENRILKQNVNMKTMKNITKFLQKGSTISDEGRPSGEQKMITHEVDLEYVLKSVTESLKTDEATYENNIERIERLLELTKISDDQIRTFQKEYDQNANTLEVYQDLMDYMNDITDCLAEKKKEIAEAEDMLDQLEENYSNMRFNGYKMDISDQLEETGAAPFEFYDEDLNYKRNTEKVFRANKRNENSRPYNHNDRIEYIIQGITEEPEYLKKDEDLNNMKYDKVALYLAAQDIFKEVADEYTNIDIIISKFYEMKDRYIAEESKVLEWLQEALDPFATVSMIGFDPLGYTDTEYEYHKKTEFNEVDFYKDLGSLEKFYEGKDGKELADRKAFIQKLTNNILGITVKNRLKHMIERQWDPFFVEETKRFTIALHLFIDIFYKQNPDKLQRHLETIKELLVSVTTKLRGYFTILEFPANSHSKFGYDMIILSVKLMRSIIAFKDILPLSNIIQIGLQSIFFNKIDTALKTFPLYEQLILYSEVLMYIPPSILEHDSLKTEVDALRGYINRIAPEALLSSTKRDVGKGDAEKTKFAFDAINKMIRLN